MIESVLADLVLATHFAFVLFVGLGGFLVLWKTAIAWAHVPCALYGAAIEFFGWTCPLTPLEVRLRRAAGEGGYEGGFIRHYLEGVLYPENWSAINLWLGIGVLVVNGVLYAWIIRRERARTGAR